MNVYARCTKNGKCSRAGSLFSSPLEHTSTALHWQWASAGLEKTTISAGSTLCRMLRKDPRRDSGIMHA